MKTLWTKTVGKLRGLIIERFGAKPEYSSLEEIAAYPMQGFVRKVSVEPRVDGELVGCAPPGALGSVWGSDPALGAVQPQVVPRPNMATGEPIPAATVGGGRLGGLG